MIALLMGGSWPNTRTRPPDVVTIGADDDDGMRIIFPGRTKKAEGHHGVGVIKI